MNVIAFLSQKGGSGKTTLSVHTAVAAEATGERVCVIDADPQESATAWASAREAGTPIVATAQAGELDAALRAAEGEGITLAVVDAPPHAAPAAGEITDRRAFARAVTTGSAVTEFEAEGKAAEEIRALWAWIRDTLERK